MKMKRFLAGFMTAAMIITGIPAAGFGSITAEAAEIAGTPDVTVEAPVTGQSQADAVLTQGVVTNAGFNTEGIEISSEGGISGKLTATSDTANNVFNVTGTTRLLMHFQMKSGEVDNLESIIGKMNSQYGVQVNNEQLLFYARFEDGSGGSEKWAQVSYTIPSGWWDAWHDIVAYYDGDALHLYVDGNEATDDRPTVRGPLREDTDSVFTIGYNNNPLPSDSDPEGNKQQYFGEIKDIAMYVGDNVPTVDVSGKTAEEIKAAYASALANAESSFTMRAGDAEKGYRVKSTTWTPTESKFADYKDYKVTVVLAADAGSTFKNASAVLRTGTEVLSGAKVSLNSSKNEMTITYTFAGEEHPRVTLQNYLKSSEVTGVGKTENNQMVNKDDNGLRKYTVDSWNAFVTAYTSAVVTAADETLQPQEYITAKAALKDKISKLVLAANKCECVLNDITGFKGNSYELYEGEEIKVELGNGSFTYGNDCLMHPGSEPQCIYELAGSPAGASLEGNVLKLTADASAVQVRLTVILGEQKKTATADFTVTKKEGSREKKELGELMNVIAALDVNDYTPESWNAMKSVYDKISKLDPATATQADYAKAYRELAAAKAALVKKDQAPGIAPGTIIAGQIGEAASGRYKVINADKKTAMLVQAKNKTKANITIPAQITINGVKCKVVQVGPNAFKGFKNLKKITLTKNITTIGKQAFSGCKKLSGVVVKGTGLKKIGAKAFKGTSKKMTVTFKAKKVTAKKRAALLKKMKKAGMSKTAKLK